MYVYEIVCVFDIITRAFMWKVIIVKRREEKKREEWEKKADQK